MPFSTYMQSEIGRAEIAPNHPLEAGGHAELTLTYTAGSFGMDDTGAIKISWRAASDSAKPQFTEPKAPNYTTAHATNGANLDLAYNRNNIRPWGSTLFIRVGGGFLREGDRIVVRLGDRSQGSPGYRLQTARENPFWFKVFVDAFATYDFVELADSPKLELVPGPVVCWKAILPTRRGAGEPFRLAVVGEDRWGNPSEQAAATLRLAADRSVDGLPEILEVRGGNGATVIEGLRVTEPGDLRIDLQDPSGALLVRSNPLRIAAADRALDHYWGDLHGQSGETVGTGTAAEYYRFARDKAFIDMVGHQGNDFQIDSAFWAEINRIAAELDEPGRFIALPGYEWSGNTGMGGDRNVFFLEQNRPIFRSSRVLLGEDHDVANDCHDVNALFAKLESENAVVIAHVGGRYADLRVGHDGRTERAVEIHSCWGTFEWLLHDAFDLGHRVGVVCHSDDHKGRPGAAWPGAGLFGAIGGLTCYLMPKLDRPTLFETLRRRHHYGTTGTRLFLDVQARLPNGALLFEDDPKLGPTTSAPAARAIMGDVVQAEGEVVLEVEAAGSAPLERIVVFNGKQPVATHRGYAERQLGRRIRVLFEGAEYRGRGREVFWAGHARLVGNRFERAQAINLFNADKPLRLAADGSRVDFDTVTTGNFSGFDLWLADADAGEIDILSDVLTTRLPIAEIGLEDRIVDAGGLERRLRAFRLPDRNETWRMRFEQAVRLRPGDNPLYVRLTQEDGHQAWSSPIYLIP